MKRYLQLFVVLCCLPTILLAQNADRANRATHPASDIGRGNAVYSVSDTLMVPVLGGTFTAGTTLTTISSFKIGRYEVTYELWTEVRTWALTHGYTDLVAGQNGYNPIGTNNPVMVVSWYDIVKWCNARSEKDGSTPVYYTRSAQDTVYRTGQIDINVDAVKWTANGYRLPTETEWEFAATGGTLAQPTPYIYSGSNTIGDVAWYLSNSGATTHPVGQKSTNELGIYDMSGNVSEWCWDWYDTTNAYPSGGTTDPKGPSTTQTYRRLRGGSFGSLDGNCCVALRSNGDYPDNRYNGSGGVGFRCVRTSTTPIGGILPTEGLVAYYPFNGNANDESGNGNHGTVNGALLTSDRFDRPNSAYEFNGVDAFIDINDANSLRPSFITIAGWIRPTISSKGAVLYKCTYGTAENEEYEVGLTSSSEINAGIKKNSGCQPAAGWVIVSSPPHTIPTNLWTFICSTWDGSQLKMYLDGALVATNPSGPTGPMDQCPGGNLKLGAGWNASDVYYSGKLDDFRIYSRALSESEIHELYSGAVDTLSLWKMQLKVSAQSYVDSDNYLGIAAAATDGFDQAFDSPKPPAPVGNYAQLYFPHPEWAQMTGDNYAQDIRLERALGDTTMRWQFEVKTNFDTTVRIDFVPDGRIPAKFGMLLKDVTAGTRTLLKTGAMSYSYKSGAGTNIRKFEIAIGDSTAPTVKLLKPNGSEIVRSAKSYSVSYSLLDKSGIDSSVVSYSTNGGTAYAKAGTVAGNSSSYAWTAPAMYLNYQGSIKVTATDSMGNSSSDVSDHLFTIVGDSLANAFVGGWSLIGLPLKPADSTSIKIFGDDISQAFYQYEYSPSGGYTKSSIFTPGRGYWLGLLANATADVVGAPFTDSVSVPLLKGFNLITNPLVVPMPKDSLKFRSMGVVKKYADALTANWIVTGLQTYKSGSYVNQDTLQLWNGYWFGVQQDNVEMIVNPPIMNGVPAPNSLPKATVVSPTDWIVNVTATYGTVSDQLMRFGVKADATTGFDSKYDEPKAPAPPAGKYVEAYFTKAWMPIFGNKYNADIRDPQPLQTWTFSVAPSDSGSVTLSWIKPIDLPSMVSLTLKDGSISIDMKKDTSYTIATKIPRDLSVNAVTTSVGKSENVPSQFELSQNFPNPFNPSTTVSYALPMDSRVMLRIYNVLGQPVAELVDAEQSAGWYRVTWNANVASGVYIYRLEAVSSSDPNKRFINVKKMILMR
jgi:formylglycine-generating enzyme required for sulfatase activity